MAEPERTLDIDNFSPQRPSLLSDADSNVHDYLKDPHYILELW